MILVFIISYLGDGDSRYRLHYCSYVWRLWPTYNLWESLMMLAIIGLTYHTDPPEGKTEKQW